MKKIFNKILPNSAKLGFTIICIALLNFSASGASFTAVASGDWSNAMTWGGVAPSFNNTLDQIVVGSGITVNMDNDVTFNGALTQITVDGTLTSTTGNTFTITSGIVTGTGSIVADNMVLGIGANLLFSGNIAVNNLSNSAPSLLTDANLTIIQTLTLNGGILNIQSGGHIGLNSGATIVIAGGSIALGGGTIGLTSSYSVIYSGAPATAGLELSGAGLQNVTINTSGTNAISLASDLTINGILTMSSGRLVLAGHNLIIAGDIANTGTGSVSSTMASNITISSASSLSGVLRFTTASRVNNFTTNVGVGNRVAISGDLNVSGAFSLTSGTLSFTSTDLIISGNIVSSGSGNLYSSSNSNLTIQTASSPTGGLSFVAGGDTINNLNISVGGGGMATLNSNLYVSGILLLTAGHLDISNHSLTIGASGSVSGGSSAHYVITGEIGSLGMMLIAGSASTTFDIGTSTEYLPATVHLNTGSADGYIRVGVMPHVFANGTIGSEISTTARVVDATWLVSTDIATTLNLNLDLTWNATAEVNSFNRSNAYISHYTSGNWDETVVSTATNISGGFYTMSRTNITSLSPFAIYQKNGTSIHDITDANTLSIYPNPFTDVLNIQLNDLSKSEKYDLNIYNLMGELMFSYNVTSPLISLQTSELPQGLYFYKVICNQQTIQSGKLISNN